MNVESRAICAWLNVTGSPLTVTLRVVSFRVMWSHVRTCCTRPLTRRSAAQDPAQLYAVETRKHEIEDYQVGSEVAGQGQTGLAVTGNLGGESGALEIQLHSVRDPRIIFDYQYCACGTTKLGSPPVYQIGNRGDLIFVPHRS